MTTRAPHRCAAGSAVAGAAERSARRRRSNLPPSIPPPCHPTRRGRTSRPSSAASARRPTAFPELELRRQAVGQRLPADRRRAEVRNRRRRNCRRHRHRRERLAASARRTRRRLRRPGRQRHVRLRRARNAHRVDHRGHAPPRPTGSSASRPTRGSCRCARHRTAFQPVGSRTDPNDPNTTQTAGSLRSLARAIVHAANLGAQVINISEAACYKVTRPINESGLGAAINYAVNVKGAVIIVAAGNTGQDCTQNPPPDAAVPADPRGWKQVQTIVSPAWYSPLVLTVGGIAPERPAEHLLDVRPLGGRRGTGARTSSRSATTAIRSTRCKARTARSRSAARRSPPRTCPGSRRCSNSASPT